MPQRVLVKIGSSVVSTPDGLPDDGAIERLAAEIVAFKNVGNEVLIVSSGAAAWGRSSPMLGGDFPVDESRVSLRGRRKTTLRSQILTLCGQPGLMGCYAEAFGAVGCEVVQIMVTRQDLAEQQRYESLRAVTTNLLRLGRVPIFIENGLLTAEDVGFRGRDELACLLATALQADRLILLTSTKGIDDGLHETLGKTSRYEVVDLDESTIGANEAAGVRSKLEAARLVTGFAIEMQVINGRSPEAVRETLIGPGCAGTRFSPRGRKLKARKSWVAMAAESRGEVVVSTFLAELLAEGKAASILVIGVERVVGAFQSREVVTVKDLAGRTLGRGEVRMSAAELRDKLEQRQTGEETSPSSAVVIHCDYFANVPKWGPEREPSN